MAVLTKIDVQERIISACDANDSPEVTQEERDRILADHLNYATHAVSTAYVFGDRVVPAATSLNGRVYRCLVGGTSSSSAPTWPTIYGISPGETITDGTALVWQDDGPADPQAWDVEGAIKAALLLKAEKCDKFVDMSDADAKITLSQKAKSYRDAAARHESMWVA